MGCARPAWMSTTEVRLPYAPVMHDSTDDTAAHRAPEPDEREPARDLAEESERALLAHLLDRALFARRKYGSITNEVLGDFLRDPECLRHPTRLIFERGGMEAHQFAQPEEDPRDPEGRRKVLYVDPELRRHPELLPLAVAYFVPVLELGEEFVDDRHCTEYGAALFGMAEKEYYERICRLADILGRESRLADD